MNFLFLMNDLENIIRTKDTSYIFMLEAYNRGYHIYYLANKNISYQENKLLFSVQKVKPIISNDKNPFELINNKIILTQDDIQAIFIRSEPPFNQQYLINTWLLNLLPENIFFLNSPSGIRQVNEKIWVNHFAQFTPKTLITQDQKVYNQFLKKNKKIIIKPIDGFGGKGVFSINNNDTNAQVAFETLTDNGNKKIIIQQYVTEAKFGDKRVLLLNGYILGTVLRIHNQTDHRNNFFTGGQAQICDITEEQITICNQLKPYLQKLKLYFVGLDFLGNKLIEINVTSPTCLQEMNKLYNENLEEKVIDFVEKKIKKYICKN